MYTEISHPNELTEVAIKLLAFAENEKIFLFFGDMGSGKTTFIKSICKQLGVTDLVSSPTFSIVNEYHSPKEKIYHFDFYRLKNEVEAFDMGLEEYLYSGNYCMIEWPEKIAALWPEHYVNVSLFTLGASERIIKAEIIDK